MGSMAPWLACLVAGLLIAPGARRAAARPWLLAFLATLALALLLPQLSLLLPPGLRIGSQWNWAGPLLALAGTVSLAWMLVRRAGMGWAEMGFTWEQRSGSLRPALAATGLALLLNVVLSRVSSHTLQGVSLETWLYQASVPGLVEESLFRGVLLALLDRAFVARRRLARAEFGYGALVVTEAQLPRDKYDRELGFHSVPPNILITPWQSNPNRFSTPRSSASNCAA